MSLIAFQLALADLATSPGLSARVAADPEAALAGRDLTPLERRRIAAAAGQPGIAVNQALYRYNRTVPLTEVLRGTAHLLGGAFRALAEEFWAEDSLDRNLRREAERFAAFLHRALASGRVTSPYLPAVLDFELTRYQLATRPRGPQLAAVAEAAARWPEGPLALHPLMRIVPFAHEPITLLRWLAARRPLPYPALPEGEFHLLLDFTPEGKYEQDVLDPAWARVIQDVLARRGDPDPDAVQRLVDGGILVRSAPDGEDVEVPEQATAAVASIG
jgi:hypothetical protein